MTRDPKIYLVLDNCFALKRWVRPLDWSRIGREIGFGYIQASTDNEIDPLFSTEDYMDEWFDAVLRAQDRTGVRVINFYTGYQTYRTVGLAHFNEGMVSNIRDNWINKLIERGSRAGMKGLGFSWFAFPDYVMQDSHAYGAMERKIQSILSAIGNFAYEHNQFQVSIEQMYVPYQPPFTIEQSERYLRECYAPHHHPIYITLDTGHMIGQSRYTRPKVTEIADSLRAGKPDIWLGPDEIYDDWRRYNGSSDIYAAALSLEERLDEYPYFFTEPGDKDVYIWFSRLAKYSPIVHMQQTDGITGGHKAFTPENNRSGIINGEDLFKAIKASYDDTADIIPPVQDIYLSFELFFSNMQSSREILRELKQTLDYWRRYVPEDGMRLSEVIARIKAGSVNEARNERVLIE
jgi:hypothetical protein